MKTISKIFLSLVVLLSSYSYISASCGAGGEGASECSYTYSLFFGLISQTHSVKCGPGTYACCNDDGASCIQGGPPTNELQDAGSVSGVIR